MFGDQITNTLVWGQRLKAVFYPPIRGSICPRGRPIMTYQFVDPRLSADNTNPIACSMGENNPQDRSSEGASHEREFRV